MGSHTCPRALWYDVDRSGLETGPRGTFRPVSGPAVFRSSSDRVCPFMTTSMTYLAAKVKVCRRDSSSGEQSNNNNKPPSFVRRHKESA